jgi:uncharacterized protein
VIALVRKRADQEAIRVFCENARNLLLTPPVGAVAVLGMNPDQRTGCAVAVVDADGSFLKGATIFPNPPQDDAENAEKALLAIIAEHGVKAIAIGSGLAARETARFVKGVLEKAKVEGVFAVSVNGAGASIYASSKSARQEFPDLDASVREAISIARRLQDPLAELVKIEPRHIGMGQYQHDVHPKLLREGLHRTVLSCVNEVGVDLNTAPVTLLRYVSGLQPTTVNSIVAFRAAAGGFRSRKQLLEVEGIGPAIYEQCAGFMRVKGGEYPLDATGIHPEAYPIVEKMAETLGISVAELLGNREQLARLDFAPFRNEVIGPSTLQGIREELAEPGHDPRGRFRVPKFLDGVACVGDLEEGMEIEGWVTNVTDFGAFVDIGVQQDGLVHLSELANRYVSDPRRVVKVGEVVKVKVIKVDKALPRISLSIKALLPPPAKKPARPLPRPRETKPSDGQGSGERAPVEKREPRPEKPRRKPEEKRDTARTGHAARAGQVRRPKKARHAPSGRSPAPATPYEDAGGPLNTLLADQLAALRERLRTGS